MADLFLFRERARLRLLANQGKQQGNVVAGLDFVSYLEVTMSKLLKTLVHLTAKGWALLWLCFTLFLSLTRAIESHWGWEAAVARAGVYAAAQITLLVTTLWLSSLTCMYPPPHMTCMYPPPPYMTCMYPPPHMTCMYPPPPHMTCMYPPPLI